MIVRQYITTLQTIKDRIKMRFRVVEKIFSSYKTFILLNCLVLETSNTMVSNNDISLFQEY